MSEAAVNNEKQWLSQVILPKILKSGRLLKHYNADAINSYKVRDIDIKFIGVEEAFMLSMCYRAAIEFEYDDVTRKISLVVKKTPELPQATFDEVNFAALFYNEMHTYSKILPAMEEFAGCTLNVPKLYFGELQTKSATVILNDFSELGWCMSKSKKDLSLEHVLLAVRYLGNFHGLGFALKQKNPERFRDITQTLKETRYHKPIKHPQYALVLRYSTHRLLKATREYQPSVDEAFLKRLVHLISDKYNYGRQLVQPIEPCATLSHGDYLRNNVAYKYEDEDLTMPSDVMMFDLQTVRVCSPMIDLTSFLALSAYSAVRNTHFERIFDAYCEELASAYVANTKLKLPQFLSREALLEEYIRFLPHSVGIAASFLLILVEPDNMTSQELFAQEKSNEEAIKDMMTRGGAEADREFAHQVLELFELSQKHNVDITKGIDLTQLEVDAELNV